MQFGYAAFKVFLFVGGGVGVWLEQKPCCKNIAFGSLKL